MMSNQRVQGWLDNLTKDDCKIISHGAKRNSLLEQTGDSFHDQVYVRTYLPESVTQLENSLKGGPHYKDHLHSQPYIQKENPTNIIKKIVREREKLTERQPQFKNQTSVNKKDSILIKKDNPFLVSSRTQQKIEGHTGILQSNAVIKSLLSSQQKERCQSDIKFFQSKWNHSFKTKQ